MESKKYNKLVNKTKYKQIHRYREQTSGYQWGEEGGSSNKGQGNKGLLWDYVKSCVWKFQVL